MKKAILLLFVSKMLFGQISENFVISNFNEGLPVGINFKWENTFYASIDGADFFKSIHIISRDSLKSRNQLAIIPVRNNGFTISRIMFEKEKEKKSEHQYRATVNLINDKEDNLAPLIVKINLNKKTLLHRWDNADKTKYEYPTVIKEYPLKVGNTFPTIKVETKKGFWTNKSGKMIVLNWWATSCLPCIEEMPGFNELVNKYKNKKIEFISIVWDKDNLEKFLLTNEFNYKHGFGDENITSLLGELFPRNLIINHDGTILYNKLGGSKDTSFELEKIITSNL